MRRLPPSGATEKNLLGGCNRGLMEPVSCAQGREAATASLDAVEGAPGWDLVSPADGGASQPHRPGAPLLPGRSPGALHRSPRRILEFLRYSRL